MSKLKNSWGYYIAKSRQLEPRNHHEMKASLTTQFTSDPSVPSDPLKSLQLRRIASFVTLLIASWYCSSAGLKAQALQPVETGIVEGRISNAITGDFLNNVRVTVAGTTLLTFTNEAGRYRIAGVPLGPASITAFYTGLDSQTVIVTVESGTVAGGNIALTSLARYGSEKDVLELDPFLVAATRETDIEAISINEQRFAPNIKSVVSTETIGDPLGGSVGDFLRFMPGVAGTFDGGLETEGILIRGFPTNYAVVAVDGAPLASNALQGGRDFSPSRFSVDSISRVEVTKVPLPSNPADTMSGSVNLVSKSAFERDSAQLKYRVGLFASGDHLTLKKAPAPGGERSHRIKPDFSFDYTLPISPNLGLVLTGLSSTSIFQYDTWYIDYIVTAAGTDASPANPLAWRTRNVEMYRTHQRHGGSARVDWRPSTHSVLSFGYRMTFFDSISNQSVFTPTAGNNGNPNPVAGGTSMSFSPTEVLGATGRGNVTQGFSFADNSSVTQNVNLRYQMDNGVWTTHAMVSHSDSKSSRRNTSRGFFNGLNVTLNEPTRVNLLNIQGGRVDDFEVYNLQGTVIDPFDINNYRLNSASSNGEIDIRSKVTQGELSGRRQLYTLAFPFSVEVGGAQRVQTNDERRVGSQVFTYTGIGGSRSAAPFLNDTYLDYRKLLAFPDKPAVPWVAPHKVYDAMMANPGAFTQTVAQMRNAASYDILNSKYIEETVSALYIQAQSRHLSNRLSAVAGARYERTSADALGPLTDLDAVFVREVDGSFARSASGLRIRKPEAGAANSLTEIPLIYQERASRAKKSYSGIYPSLHLNWSATERLMVRGAYARTYGRPNLGDIIPNTSLAQDDPANDGDLAFGRITYSNVGLKPWTAHNYDLSVEYYTDQGGVLSTGIFLKEVSNFFGTMVKEATIEDLAALGLDDRFLGWRLTSQFNSGSARVTGYELSVRHSLGVIGDWASGITIFANATKLNLEGHELADFSGFLPKSINGGINYSRKRLTAIAKWNYRGAQQGVLFPMRGPDAYRYPQPRTQLDLSFDFRVKRGISLYINIRNATNSFQKEYIYGSETPEYARQFSTGQLGRVFTMGVKGVF